VTDAKTRCLGNRSSGIEFKSNHIKREFTSRHFERTFKNLAVDAVEKSEAEEAAEDWRGVQLGPRCYSKDLL
ncbi:hypothetical protein BgiBS90_013165, partial [Biomphalaria glabrata]